MIGRGFFYYRHDRLGAGVLALSANTGFADFPRLCRVIAQDGFLPSGFAHRGRRLVYSQGILVLAALSGGILIAFGGITDHLIPLFAVGAFLAFTLSQAGMVAHWQSHRRRSLRGSRWSINAAGAICTGVTLVVVLVSKFLEGAWVMFLLVPGLLVPFLRGQEPLPKDRPRGGHATSRSTPTDLKPPVVLLPIRGWSAITRKALRFALKISPEIYALHIAGDEQTMVALEDGWKRLVRSRRQKRKVARAQADHRLFPVSPALSAADGGRHRPEEGPPGPRYRRDHSRADRDQVVPLHPAQPDRRRDRGVPAPERLPAGHCDQRAVVSGELRTGSCSQCGV